MYAVGPLAYRGERSYIYSNLNLHGNFSPIGLKMINNGTEIEPRVRNKPVYTCLLLIDAVILLIVGYSTSCAALIMQHRTR